MSPKFPLGQPFPVEIPWPFGGLSDEQAYDDQPIATSSELQNVRGEDRVTGRVRGAKREGRTKQNGTAVDATYGVRELASATYTQPTVTYTSDPGEEWSQATPGNVDCWDGQVGPGLGWCLPCGVVPLLLGGGGPCGLTQLELARH